MTIPLLSVNNLSKIFHHRGQKVHAVDNVSFTLNAGETWALVGESGRSSIYSTDLSSRRAWGLSSLPTI